MKNSSKINSSNNTFDETQFSFYNNKNNNTPNDKNNEKKYKEQINILNKNNKSIPENYNLPYEKMHTATPGLFGQRHTPDYNNIQNRKNDKYDHLGDYYYKKGDRNYSSITRYYTHYLNIDSRLRNITPVYTNLDYINLHNNPLQVTFDSNELFIKTNDLIKLNVNDKISLTGLYNTNKNLKVDNTFFVFTNMSYYVKVNYPHTLYFQDITQAKIYSNTDLYVQFLDITKNVNPEINFINNIPINTLNTIQQVYLYNPDNDDYSNEYFFIKLIKPFSGLIDPSIIYTFTFKLVYLYNYGISNNKINSQYPINAHNNQGYLLVKKITSDGIIVELSNKANFRYIQLGNIINYGGNNICISKINELIKGYPIPNEYYVELDRTFNNVIMIKLISSEFPVLNKLVYECKNDSELNMNNKLYWQNYEDHEINYSVSISQGNYTMQQLITLIEQKVQEVQRQTTPELFGNYNKKNIIKIDYYEGNNEIKFYSYKEAELIDPFIEVIEVDLAMGNYKIKIYHPNHNLLNSDKIIISDALSYGGFSANILNGTFYIQYIDNNNYYINLTNVNRDVNYTPDYQYGGNSVNILVENIFRLLFDFNDTLGAFFGFRHLGEKKSVTRFATVISNKYLYEGEFLDQSLICTSENNNNNNNNNEVLLRTIQLEDQNYIYMSCDAPNVETNIINQMITFSKIKNVFSKIQIHHDTNIINNIVYNTFTCNPSYMHNPIPELKELYFKFYDKYGNLLEYSDFEHSFTLEITTIGEIPEGTNLSLKYPKIN